MVATLPYHKYQLKSNFQVTSRQTQVRMDSDKTYEKGNKRPNNRLRVLLMILINLSLIKFFIIKRENSYQATGNGEQELKARSLESR